MSIPIDLGVGVAAGWIANKFGKKTPDKQTNLSITVRFEGKGNTDPDDQLRFKSSGISERLANFVNLLNVSLPESERLVPSQIAELLGLRNANVFLEYLNGKEPNFSFCDKFCNRFKVNPQWLKHGTGHPFQTKNVFRNLVERQDSNEGLRAYDQVFLVRSTGLSGRATAVFQAGDMNFIACSDNIHISSDVGGTGRRQLRAFYFWMLCIQPTKVTGIEMDSETFTELVNGCVFAGVVTRRRFNKIKQSYWCDDFIEIHKEHQREKFRQWYGDEFLEAQSIVRSMLNFESGKESGQPSRL